MAKKTKSRLPEKRTMNLYKNGDKTKKQSRNRTIIIIIAIVFVLVGVIGRYGLLAYKAYKLKGAEQTLASYQSQLTNYKEIKTEYERYSKTYLTPQEKVLEERSDLIICANNCINGYGTIQTITIQGNTATVNFVINNMHDLPDIVANFENFNNTSNISVGTVSRTTSEDGETGAKSGTITSTISFQLGEALDEGQGVQ